MAGQLMLRPTSTRPSDRIAGADCFF